MTKTLQQIKDLLKNNIMNTSKSSLQNVEENNINESTVYTYDLRGKETLNLITHPLLNNLSNIKTLVYVDGTNQNTIDELIKKIINTIYKIQSIGNHPIPKINIIDINNYLNLYSLEKEFKNNDLIFITNSMFDLNIRKEIINRIGEKSFDKIISICIWDKSLANISKNDLKKIGLNSTYSYLIDQKTFKKDLK